jgi:hypothetical protein
MHFLNLVKNMPFNLNALNWNTLLPFLCVGFLAGIISTLLPMLETLLLAAGIGALTGSLMRYCRSQSGGGSAP